jgi:hypothetical protein
MTDSTYNAFEHLWRSLVFGEGRRQRLFAMLTVYLDESGTDGGSPIVMVGGYVSTVEGWERFATEWGAFLKEEGLETFHCKNISDERLHKKASSIINRNVLMGTISHVEIEPCEQHIPLRNPTKNEGRSKFSAEYGLAGVKAVYGILEWANQCGHTEPINFVFEAGGPGKGMIADALSTARKTPSVKLRHLIGGVSFIPKGPDVPQLEAADKCVYDGCKIVRDRLAGYLTLEQALSWLAVFKIHLISFVEEDDFPHIVDRGWEVYLATQEFKQKQRDKAKKKPL